MTHNTRIYDIKRNVQKKRRLTSSILILYILHCY